MYKTILSCPPPNFNYFALLIHKNRKREIVSFVGNITSKNVPLILRVFAILIIMVKITNIKLFFHKHSNLFCVRLNT